MSPGRSPLTVETVNAVTVVHCRFDAVLEESLIREIREQLTMLLEQQSRPQLLLDLNNVRRLSSYLVSVVVWLEGQVAAVGGRLALCGIRPELAEVLRITGLARKLAIYPNSYEALGSFPSAKS